jgi:hypothetical protein
VAAVWLDLQGRLQSDAHDDVLAASVRKRFSETGVLPSQVLQILSERLF